MTQKRRNPGGTPAELSRMPDDEAYWDELARRVERRAAPVLAVYANRTGGWLGWIGDRSPALAAGAALIAALAWLWLPPALPLPSGGEAPPSSEAAAVDVNSVQPSMLARALAPNDRMASGLLSDPEPPSIGVLLRLSSREEP